MSTTFSMEELKDKMPEDVSRCFPEKDITLYRGKGCESCNHTGYKGRIAIFEVIKNTPELQNLILTNPSTQQVWKLARSQGARSLFEDGIEKVKSGVHHLPPKRTPATTRTTSSRASNTTTRNSFAKNRTKGNYPKETRSLCKFWCWRRKGLFHRKSGDASYGGDEYPPIAGCY